MTLVEKFIAEGASLFRPFQFLAGVYNTYNKNYKLGASHFLYSVGGSFSENFFNKTSSVSIIYPVAAIGCSFMPNPAACQASGAFLGFAIDAAESFTGSNVTETVYNYDYGISKSIANLCHFVMKDVMEDIVIHGTKYAIDITTLKVLELGNYTLSSQYDKAYYKKMANHHLKDLFEGIEDTRIDISNHVGEVVEDFNDIAEDFNDELYSAFCKQDGSRHNIFMDYYLCNNTYGITTLPEEDGGANFESATGDQYNL